ncbi:hypothetical protein MKEN_00368700 [Mycena kentingensis (nom. inval.)]|nr:hypothetical protein MKEN_00368700 [Mycena kentingensis (nom. inval.)]
MQEPNPNDYDPALEFPGIDDDDGQLHPVQPPTLEYTKTPEPEDKPCRPLLRLVVLRTGVLPKKHTLVVVPDEHTELQFGRDASHSNDVPRVRLKEMEVSKFHATLYWDEEAWHIVDMGSMHGTFHQSGRAQSSAAVRLSPSRIASPPRKLAHRDAVAVGSTTFLVHIHDEDACEECSAGPENEIPLFQTKKHAAPPKPAGYLPSQRDSKKALSSLKQQLLSGGGPGPIRTRPAGEYVDRSAKRRALYPASRLDAPGVAEVSPLTLQTEPPGAAAESWEPPPPLGATSAPPTPVPSTNIGHRLLLAQGWTPGTSLGLEEGIVEPLNVASTTRRAGLGMNRT